MQQTTLIAGDTLKYITSGPDYPASDGYTATTRLVRRDAVGTPIAFDATASGDDYQFNVLPATTAAWEPDFYTWSLYVSKAGERYTVDAGELRIKADPALATAPLDERSWAARAVAAIEAAIEGRASSVQLEISIAGRAVKYMSHADLIVARSKLQRELSAEQASADLAKGIKRKTRILTRFGRPS